ncbi:hypothetical protein NAS141_14276 [Sulfitobacter sp. NAS-14.1]|nr:hypothetical protein NAS141_14276 [Sulfitobacter sp. NAS-14.1]
MITREIRVITNVAFIWKTLYFSEKLFTEYQDSIVYRD